MGRTTNAAPSAAARAGPAIHRHVTPSPAPATSPVPGPYAGGTMKSPLTQPAVSYDSLSSLPSNPRALVTLLGKTPVTRARAWRAGHAFELIAELLQSYVMPPQPTAQVYHALGMVSGVVADEHALDVAGGHGAGFLLTGTGGNQKIIVNPRTYQFCGYQFLGSGRDIGAEARGVWSSSARRSSRGPGSPWSKPDRADT